MLNCLHLVALTLTRSRSLVLAGTRSDALMVTVPSGVATASQSDPILREACKPLLAILPLFPGHKRPRPH